MKGFELDLDVEQDLIKLMIRINETASNHSPEYILFFRELNLMEKYLV